MDFLLRMGNSGFRHHCKQSGFTGCSGTAHCRCQSKFRPILQIFTSLAYFMLQRGSKNFLLFQIFILYITMSFYLQRIILEANISICFPSTITIVFTFYYRTSGAVRIRRRSCSYSSQTRFWHFCAAVRCWHVPSRNSSR